MSNSPFVAVASRMENENNRNGDDWNHNIQKVKKFVQEHGHCLITPANCKDDPDFLEWISKVRSEFKNSPSGGDGSSLLTNSKIAELNLLEFPWILSDVNELLREKNWDARLEELKLYFKENGDYEIPRIYPTNQSLSLWMRRQRTEYRNRMKRLKSTMTDARVDKLESIDFSWNLGESTDVDKKPPAIGEEESESHVALESEDPSIIEKPRKRQSVTVDRVLTPEEIAESLARGKRQGLPGGWIVQWRKDRKVWLYKCAGRSPRVCDTLPKALGKFCIES